MKEITLIISIKINLIRYLESNKIMMQTSSVLELVA